MLYLLLKIPVMTGKRSNERNLLVLLLQLSLFLKEKEKNFLSIYFAILLKNWD